MNINYNYTKKKYMENFDKCNTEKQVHYKKNKENNNK